MTGEEVVTALLDRIAAKRAKVGELTLTLGSLEQLLKDALLPAEKRPEPGFPKKMTKMRVNETPWVPKGPEPPSVTWVNNRSEEAAAIAAGFHE